MFSLFFIVPNSLWRLTGSHHNTIDRSIRKLHGAAGASHLFYRMTESCLFHTRPFTSVIHAPALFHTQAPMTATSPAGPTDSPTCHKTPIGLPILPCLNWARLWSNTAAHPALVSGGLTAGSASDCGGYCGRKSV